MKIDHETRTALRDHLIYLVVVAVYSLPYLFGRDLFFRDESRYGAVVKEMIRNEAWFTLTLGGDLYAEKPPLFFSLVRLASEITGTTAAWVFFAVVALSAFFFVAASDAFLRAAGSDRRTALAANLLLLSVPWIAIHMQRVRMDLLFSGLILLSLACYIRGVNVGKANFRTLAGGALAGLAVLTKGPFGALIPMLSVAGYLAATQRLRLIMRPDVLWSVLLLLLPVVAWFASIYAAFGRRVLDIIFVEQILDRALYGRDARRPAWHYLLWLALTLMPWLLLLPTLLVKRIRSIVLVGAGTATIRLPDFRLILPMQAVTIILLALVAQRNIHYLLPLTPGLMVLVAIAYIRLDAGAPRVIDWFYVGVALAALTAPPAGIWAFELASESLKAHVTSFVRYETLTLTAATLSLTAIPLAVAARLKGQARLVAGVVAVSIMVIAVKATVPADLDRVYNPRHVAATFERHVPEGEPILVYSFYRGSLSYHFSRPLVLAESEDDLARLFDGPDAPAYVIIARDIWRRTLDLWTGFEIIEERRLENKRVLLLRHSAER